MNECRLILILITAILISGCKNIDVSNPKNPEMRLISKVLPSQPRPGETFTYSISLDYDSNVYNEKQLPPQIGSQIKGLSVVEDRLNEIKKVGSRVYISRDYKLRAELAGAYILPEARIKTRDGNEIKSGKIYLEVTAEEQGLGEQDILDIDPLVDQQFDRQYVGYLWLLSVIGLVSLAFFVYRNSNRDELLEVPLEPWEWVELELERSNLEVLIEQESFRDFYDSWSRICRGYFNRRFALQAEESTLEELLPALKKIDLPEKLQHELQAIFPEADLARFADIYRGQSRLDVALNALKSLVDQTTSKDSEDEQYENLEEGDEIA